MVALSLGSGSASAVTESEPQNLVFDGATLTWNTNTENKVFTNAAGESASFAPGDNVTFASDATASLGEDISAGQINIASGADVVIELADNGLNFDTLSMLGGSLDAGDSLNIAAGETLAVGSNGSVIKSEVVLGNDARLSVDYAGTGSATSLNNYALSLQGGTRLQLSGCGNGDGKTYTLLTGVSGLLDAQGNAIVLDFTTNAIANYFDTTQPGTGFWAGGTLQMSNGTLQMELHNETVKAAQSITSHQDNPADYQYYVGLTFIYGKSSYGGAIYGSGDVELSNNGNVTFNGNAADYGGGAIYGSRDVVLSNNGSVTFSGNSASSGGAIYGIFSTIMLSNNDSVVFEGNTASSTDSANFGGAIYASNGTISMSNNSSVTFSGNSASGSWTRGGAIYASNGTITLSNNGSVTFSGNTASSDGHSSGGGAIYENTGNAIELNNNGSVTFSGNMVENTSGSVYGGAIETTGSLSIRNNDSVLFEKNVEKTNSSYRLRSVYMYGGNADTLSLSAAAGKSIEFRDSVYVGSGSTVNLNEDYTYLDAGGQSVRVKQSGDIIFTGKYAKAHLNLILEADGAERSATSAEISNSLTTEVKAMTNLYGGCLRVEDGAIYTGYGITAMEDSAATVGVQNAELKMAGYNLIFNTGTTLELAGDNTISGNVQMLGGSNLSIDAGGGIGATDIIGNLQFTGGSSFSLSSGNTSYGINEILLYTTGEVTGWDGVQQSLPGNESVTWVGNLLVLNYQASTFNRYFNGSACYNTPQSASGYHHYEMLSFIQCDATALSGTYVFIRDNEKVLFEKNGGDGTCLRSIKSTGGMDLAAPEGGEIRFHDGSYAAGAVVLNSSSGSTESTGAIILDGSLAETHFADVMGRSASAEELQLSRTHQWKKTATLHNGTLQVQGNAYLDVSQMSVLAGELSLDSSNMRSKSFVLESDARLSLAGSNYVQLGAADLSNGSVLSFSNLPMMDNCLEGEIDFANLTIHIADEQLAKGTYKLFTLTHSSSATWDADTIALEGVDEAMASLVWNKGCLYLNYGNAENAMMESILWKNNRIQAEADCVYIDSLEDWENSRVMGSQRFALTQDVVGRNVLIDGSLYWGRLYELSSANEAEPVDLEFKNSTTGGLTVCNVQDIFIHGMDNIRFLDNSSDKNGGAIYGGSIELRKNSRVELCRNSVDFYGMCTGGAIIGDEIILSDNALVRVENNSVRNGYHAYGGAISGSKIMLNDNGSVIFRGNTASSDYSSFGGAIEITDSLSIRNNDSVVFEKNAEITEEGYGCGYRLCSIYAWNNSSVSLSAAEGKSIIFRDSVWIRSGSTFNLNEVYSYLDDDGIAFSVSQNGDIVFTGATTVDDLYKVKGYIYGTADEENASRTSMVDTMTNLYGGRLRVEDGAIYQGYGITAHEESSATVRVKDATLSHSGYELHFFEGTTLETLGESEIFGDVIVESTATAAFSALTRLEGCLTLVSGSTLLLDGEFTLNGTLTLGTGVTLGGNVLELLNQLQCGQSLTLIRGLDSLMVQSLNALSTTEHSALATNQELRAGDYFSNLNSNLVLKYNGEVGSLSVARVIPEPATTTLSLLALTALMSRRRRK